MNSVVYFIKPVGCDGPVKIGCSTLIRDRMAGLNAWSPIPLEVAATIPGSYDLERRFHALFLSSRDHAEWFAWSPQLGEIIDQINAGTFDVSGLPEPVFLQSPGKAKAAREPKQPKARQPVAPSFRDEALLGDVLEFCAKQDLPPSLFGRAAANDPCLVRQMKLGRTPRAKVSQRVRSFMASYGGASA